MEHPNHPPPPTSSDLLPHRSSEYLGVRGVSPRGATMTDFLRAFGPPVAWAVGLTILASIVLDNSGEYGFRSASSWLIGLLCVAVGLISGWWAIVAPSRRPDFPTGSRLKGSIWRRGLGTR